MYIYLENNYFIPLNEILTIVNFEKFISTEDGKNFIEKNKKDIIDVAKTEKKSIVITDRYIYITSYTTKVIYTRGNEFEKLKKKLKWR
jgi:extracellular matrix regulatory protein B